MQCASSLYLDKYIFPVTKLGQKKKNLWFLYDWNFGKNFKNNWISLLLHKCGHSVNGLTCLNEQQNKNIHNSYVIIYLFIKLMFFAFILAKSLIMLLLKWIFSHKLCSIHGSAKLDYLSWSLVFFFFKFPFGETLLCSDSGNWNCQQSS